MSKHQLLSFARSDNAVGASVLVNVESAGSQSLDLKLVGTDGSDPFVGHIQASNFVQLRDKSYNGTNEEWSDILSTVFARYRKDVDHETVQHLETVASVGSHQMVLAIRKNIGGIMQRLGSIILQEDSEVEIALFNWSLQSASTAADLRFELLAARFALEEKERAAEKLTLELEDLVRAKKEHEEQLIGKFAKLLNAKKLKIRDQQRMLAAGKSSSSTGPSSLSERNDSNRKHGAQSSRSSKRKAASEDEEDSEDGFETPAQKSDRNGELRQTGSDEPGTPRSSEQDDTDASNDELDTARVTSKQMLPETRTGRQAEVKELPPRRELPFNKKADIPPAPPSQREDKSAGQKSTAPMDDDETDDEL